MSLGEKDASEVLGSLQGKGDHYTKLSVIERKRLQDLEDAIAHIMSETNKYRSWAKKAAIEVMNLHVLTPNPAYQRADGVSVAKDAQQVTTKALTILEMKVNKLLQRQSLILIQNKALRQEIDHFRQLRLQTDTSHLQFEEGLRLQKIHIEERLAESAAIVEERERLVEEKEALEVINREEQRKFEEEFNEMGAFIAQQNEALENSLLQERKEDQKKRSMNNGSKGADGSEGDDPATKPTMSLEEEVALARQLGNLNQYAQSEASFLSGIDTKISNYENMFDQLKRMSGTESLDEVVNQYVATEEEMFSLYHYMKQLNADIEAVAEASAALDQEMSMHKREQEEQDSMRRKILDELQSRLQTSSEQTQVSEEDNKMLAEHVLQVAKKINTFFFKIQCDQMDSKAKDGAESRRGPRGATMSRPDSKVALLQAAGVTDSNVLEYLGCIEQRSVDIISEYLRRQAEGKINAPLSPTPGPSSPSRFGLPQYNTTGGTAPMQAIAVTSSPTVDLDALGEDELNDNDEDGRIIDLGSFKSKLKKRVLGGDFGTML